MEKSEDSNYRVKISLSNAFSVPTIPYKMQIENIPHSIPISVHRTVRNTYEKQKQLEIKELSNIEFNDHIINIYIVFIYFSK